MPKERFTMRMLTLILFVVLVAACEAPRVRSATPELQSCPTLAITYFRKPLKQTIAEFTSYGLETQYTIYLCGNQYMHPPALHLATQFASGGQRAAVFLKEKLSQMDDDATIRDIVRVFVEMQRQGTYDVKGDSLLIQLLNEKVRSIQDGYWQNFCRELMGEIEGN